MEKPMPPEKPNAGTPTDVEVRSSLQHVEEALRGLRFGSVTITVHDGAVVQVERIEKKRLPPKR
jgi:hypothetical protein